MKIFLKSVFTTVLLAMMCSIAVHAQSNDDKEVIIIEKIQDENGNIISKRIKRSRNGDLTDEEIEKELESSSFEAPFGKGSFDLNNFDFLKNNNSKPTLGVVLNIIDDQIVISDVTPRSGAEDAELRKDDIIISVDGFVVSTVNEIKKLIDGKSEGDFVLLSIIRDGDSFEKKVTLRVNNFMSNNPFGNFDPESFKSFGQIFDMEGDQMPFDLDSLFKGFEGFDGLKGFDQFKGGNSPLEYGLPNYSDRKVEEDKPSLGVFIDEENGKVIITEVLEDSPAEKAKLKAKDVIVKIDGNKITSFDDLATMIRAAGKNTTLIFTYERSGKMRETKVTLQ